MEIDRQADFAADRIAHGLHVFQYVGHLLVGVDELHLLGRVHLDRGEPARHRFLRRARGVRRAVAANPRVHPDPVAHLAAEQRMHRHAQRLAVDIPQRLVDPGQRAHQHRPAAVETAAIQHVPVILDQARILADEVVGQLLHRGGHGMRAALHDGFAPAADARIGIDADEQPAWRHEIRRDGGDLHGVGSRLVLFHASMKARARRATSVGGVPGAYSAEPMPKPVAPASR